MFGMPVRFFLSLSPNIAEITKLRREKDYFGLHIQMVQSVAASFVALGL